MEATLTAAVADTEVVAMVAVAAAMVMAAEVAMVRVMEATTGKFFFILLSFFLHHSSSFTITSATSELGVCPIPSARGLHIFIKRTIWTDYLSIAMAVATHMVVVVAAAAIACPTWAPV